MVAPFTPARGRSAVTIQSALRSAAVAMVAVLASFGVIYAVCMRLGVDASPAILAAAICVGLMRRDAPHEPRVVALEALALPLVALGAGLVGLAFRSSLALGAIVFAGGITLSIWLRNFGDRGRAIGRTIALPLMAILIVPVHVDAARGTVLPAVLMLAAGAVAFAVSTAVSWLALRLRAVEPGAPRAARSRADASRRGRISISTRMALQMLVALVLAFAIGIPLFPAHWSWIVLTAFIVCSGAVARGDAIYKGLLRVAGAIGGTLVAAVVAYVALPGPAAYAAVVFAVLFAGMFLRQLNYAYWAACATLIFALLQGPQGAGAVPLFATRVLCIVIGAICAVAAAWFVYPIRTERIVLRRVADALAAVRDVVTHAPEDPGLPAKVAALGRHADELERVAPPVRLHRAVFGAARPDEHPATWIDLMHGLLAHVRTPGFDRAHAGAEMRRLGAMLKARSSVPEQTAKAPAAAARDGGG